MFNIYKQTRYGTLIYNKNDLYIGKSLELYGEFSEGEMELFRQAIKSGMTVLDIGANIGIHTLVFSQLTGLQGKVFAFEPQRLIFQILTGNIAINSIRNVYCYQFGVGSEPGIGFIPDINYEVAGNFGGFELENYESGEPVQIITIDDLNLPDCNFIKIDVEGMEQKVIEGAKETINKFRPLLYVENDRKDKAKDLILDIYNLGYELYWHQVPLFNPDNYNNNSENVFGDIQSINMICIPKEKNNIKFNNLNLIKAIE